MTLTNEESEFVLDYIFQCAEQEHSELGTTLIASNPKGAEVYSCIKQALAKLEHMKDDGCPDKLVDLTIARLKLATVNQSSPRKKLS
ncbi:MAG: hypothetical protein ACO2Y4_07280 [Burkholderiaceae bacterium]